MVPPANTPWVPSRITYSYLTIATADNLTESQANDAQSPIREQHRDSNSGRIDSQRLSKPLGQTNARSSWLFELYKLTYVALLTNIFVIRCDLHKNVRPTRFDPCTYRLQFACFNPQTIEELVVTLINPYTNVLLKFRDGSLMVQ